MLTPYNEGDQLRLGAEAHSPSERLKCVLLKFKLLGGSGAFSIMQIRLKQPSSLHRPLVQLRIFSPPFGLGLVVLVVLLVLLVLLVQVLVLVCLLYTSPSPRD